MLTAALYVLCFVCWAFLFRHFCERSFRSPEYTDGSVDVSRVAIIGGLLAGLFLVYFSIGVCLEINVSKLEPDYRTFSYPHPITRFLGLLIGLFVPGLWGYLWRSVLRSPIADGISVVFGFCVLAMLPVLLAGGRLGLVVFCTYTAWTLTIYAGAEHFGRKLRKLLNRAVLRSNAP